MPQLAGFCLLLVVGAAEPHRAPDAKDFRALSKLVHSILAPQIPPVIEEKDNWGKTVRIFDGWRFQDKGDKRKLVARKKEVEHGLWKRFRVDVRDPKKALSLEVKDFQKTGENRFGFIVDASLPFQAEAELKHFNNGVQWLGVTVRANSTVRLILVGEVEFQFRPDGLRSRIDVAPRVLQSRLELTAFDLLKVGDIKGKAAHELGDDLRGVIRKVLHKNESRIRDEVNLAVAKSMDQGKLQFSPLKFLEVKTAANSEQKKKKSG